MTEFLEKFLELLKKYHGEGWFAAQDLSLCYFSRSVYNLDRLVDLGEVEREVYGNIYKIKVRYRIANP